MSAAAPELTEDAAASQILAEAFPAASPLSGAAEEWALLGGRLGNGWRGFYSWLAARVDNAGDESPMRPGHVVYPTPPMRWEARAMKVGIGALMGLGGAGFFATHRVAEVAHAPTQLGSSLGNGFYFPTDLIVWHIRYGQQPLPADAARFLASLNIDQAAFLAAITQGEILTGIGTALGVAAGVAMASRYKARIPKGLEGIHGTAEWASAAQVRKAGLVWDERTPAIYVGELERPKLFGHTREPLILAYPGPRHVITNAASRSGKDVGTNTMTLCVTWTGAASAVVNDPKGESHLQTSGVREHVHGNKIVRFAPLAPEIGEVFREIGEDGQTLEERVEQFGSTKWDPLGEVDLGSDDEFSDLLQIATMVNDPTGKAMDGENSHWAKTSRVVTKALETKVLYDPLEPVKCMPRVADLFMSMNDPQHAAHAELRRETDGANPGTITEMLEHWLGFSATGFGGTPKWLTRSIAEMRARAEREILVKRDEVGMSVSEADAIRFEAERRRRLDTEIRRLENEMRHPDLERDLRSTLRIQGEEQSSVFSTTGSNLTSFLDPLIMRNMSRCEARIKDIGLMPLTWYNVNSIAKADMGRPIMRLWWELAWRKLVPQMKVDRETKRSTSPWRVPILFLFNERGSLGTIPAEAESLPVAASYGITCHYLFQTPGQEKEVAGENSVITPNCGVQVFHTPQDPDDQKSLSERLGQRTIVTETYSFSNGQRTESWQAQAMPLMTPQQVAEIPTEPVFRKDERGRPIATEHAAYQLVWAPNTSPIYSRKSQWFMRKRLAEVIQGLPASRPTPIRVTKELVDEVRVAQAVAEPHRPETGFRSRARVAEAVRLRRIDVPDDGEPPEGGGGPPPPDAPAGGGPSGASSPHRPGPDWPTAPVAPTGPTAAVVAGPRAQARPSPNARRFRVLTMDQRIVARDRGAAQTGDVAPGFSDVLGRPR